MKTKYNIIFMMAISLLFIACEKHDMMDNDVIVGQMAPQVYWEPASSTVKAGENVPFMVQYYTTTTENIDRLEVWYNIIEDEAKAVSSPWVSTFTYSVTSNKSLEKRVSQKISTYAHEPNSWNDSVRAFMFKTTFPTSNTLASVTWSKPATFDNDKMVKYFGTTFMTQFKDSLFKLMKPKDFQKMYLGLNLLDNFKIYIDSVKNENTGGWDYVFPKDLQGNRTIPKTLVDLYATIPFSDIIFNKTTNVYDVDYSRSYRINANIKAFDKKGVAGLGIVKEISLN